MWSLINKLIDLTASIVKHKYGLFMAARLLINISNGIDRIHFNINITTS